MEIFKGFNQRRPKNALRLISLIFILSLFQNCDGFHLDSGMKSGSSESPLAISPALTIESDSLSATSGRAAFELEFISVRLEEPAILRGPYGDEGDTYLSQIRLNNGSFRSFSANSNTYSIDSTENWNIGGPRRLALPAGTQDDLSECGRWITSIVKNVPNQKLGRWIGLVHNESSCNYTSTPMQTYKSISLYSSDDEGLSWQSWGAILRRDAAISFAITGDGDCSLVNPNDGYLYAYCLYWPSGTTFVARAATFSLGPGGWMKYNNGVWGSTGLYGGATPLPGNPGASALYFQNLGRVGLLFGSHYFGGIQLSFSRAPGDFINFIPMKDPLVHFLESAWIRDPSAPGLYSYESGLNPMNGGNEVGNNFNLWYSYIPPGELESQRYKVLQTVSIVQGTTKPLFQVGTALIQWGNPNSGFLRTTSLPVLGNGSTWIKENRIGYLMTRAPDNLPALRLEECRNQKGEIADDMLAPAGSCGANRTLGSLGWVFRTQQPSTLPLYRCYNPTLGYHFASTSDRCNGRGSMEFLLGFIPQS